MSENTMFGLPVKSRFQLGPHPFVELGDGEIRYLEFCGVFEASHVEQLYPAQEAMTPIRRYVFVANAAGLDGIPPDARRAVAKMNTNEDSLAEHLIFSGANVVRRAVLKLAITAARLADKRDYVVRFVETPEDAIKLALEIAESLPKSA